MALSKAHAVLLTLLGAIRAIGATDVDAGDDIFRGLFDLDELYSSAQNDPGSIWALAADLAGFTGDVGNISGLYFNLDAFEFVDGHRDADIAMVPAARTTDNGHCLNAITGLHPHWAMASAGSCTPYPATPKVSVNDGPVDVTTCIERTPEAMAGPSEPQPPRYVCNYCLTPYTSKNGILIHQRGHCSQMSWIEQAHYECTSCLRSFAYKTGLQRHQRNHCRKSPTFRRRHPCKYCSTTFAWKTGLRQHMRDECEYSPTARSRAPRAPSAQDCQVCSRSFEGAKCLREHVRHSCRVLKRTSKVA